MSHTLLRIGCCIRSMHVAVDQSGRSKASRKMEEGAKVR